MKCQKCGNTATLHYTKMTDGQVTEYHLCPECAKEEGLWGNLSFDFGSLFSNFLGSSFQSSPTVKRCPGCGCSLAEFQKVGRLGCADCYHTFYEELAPALKRIHGSAEHTGKLPKEVQGEVKAKRQIDRLKRELKEAIQKEDFEKAASLRDQIREMEGLS